MQIETNRTLAEFSTFGIGGPIKAFFEVRTADEMAQAFAWGQGMPIFVLGRGSNCLFDDAGFDGLVVLNRIEGCVWEGNRVEVGAGYSFALLGVQSARNGWSGLEFASGIPASVGGAVFMNAGANGGETFQCLESVEYVHLDGARRRYPKEELTWGYRKSAFQEWQGAIVGATFALERREGARERQLQIVDYRLKTQPYKDKSAGCVFRNPKPDLAAGALIDRCGLKGLTVGGAAVSEMHANFLINRGGARAVEIRALIGEVQKRVFEETGVRLEPEIRMVGRDGRLSS